MICLIALVVCGILGIFSLNYRIIAKDALDCVFKRVTLRKCDTGLDKKLKAQITGRLVRAHPALGKLAFRYFELLSWLFTFLMIWSIVSAAWGGYNYYFYGNCNGPTDTGFCIFDPTGHNLEVTPEEASTCSASPQSGKLSLEGIDLSSFPTIDYGSQNTVVFVGCYECAYSREVYPAMQQLLEDQKPNFIFAHFPVKGTSLDLSSYSICVYNENKDAFWSFNKKLFETPLNMHTKENINSYIEELGLDAGRIQQCVASNDTISLAQYQVDQLKKSGVYGTPTIFINGEGIVGPRPYRVYKGMLK